MSYPVYYPVEDDTLPIFFDTFDGGTGASITMTGLAVTDIEIYKDGSVTQRASDNGYTLLDTDGIDFDGTTGIHGFSIDLSDNSDAGFFAVDSWYHVVVSSVTIDGQTVNFIAAAFRILSATRGMAGTALPAVAAEAAGGLYTRGTGAGQINQPANGRIDADVAALNQDQGAAANLEADYNGTGYNKSASTIGTCTTNTDMRGTDNAALASVLGALADSAAAGDPTVADTAMQYLKQIVNVLVGTTGVTTFPVEAAPANNVSFAEVIRAIHADVTGLNGDAMRGTDGANTTTPPTAAAVADQVWDEAQADHTSVGSFGEVATEIASILADTNELQSDDVPGLIAALNDPTVAQIADQVWDEAQGDHVAVGSFGEIATEIASILADTNELQSDDVPGLIAALNDPTAATIAAAVWNAVRSSHTTSGTFGESYNGMVSGAAAAGTLSTTQMTTDLTETTDDHYNGRTIIWITGNLAGQASDVTAYQGSNGMLTFTAVTEAPSAGDRFVMV